MEAVGNAKDLAGCSLEIKLEYAQDKQKPRCEHLALFKHIRCLMCSDSNTV